MKAKLRISSILFSVLIALAALCCASFVRADAFDEDAMFYLEKSSGSDFVILQFTDTHIPSAQEGERNIFPNMRKWAEQLSPDLIVITGDGVNGTSDGNDMKALIAFMNGLGLPWAYVFGNHEKDAAGGIAAMSKLLREDAMRENSLLLYDEGPFTEEGRYGNYVVNIEQRGKLIYSLFFLDSGREYETFTDAQTQWYAEGVQAISKRYLGSYAPFEGLVAPSMVFHHIPTDEYQYAANSVLSEPLTFTEEDGSSYTYQNVKVGEVPKGKGSGANYEFAYGMRDGRVKNARIHSSEADKALLEYAMYEDKRSEAGFFSIAKDLHSTTHMFCGHRHTNDATVYYEGITLTFGTKTGSGNSAGGVQSGCTVAIIANRTGQVTVTHHYDEEVSV